MCMREDMMICDLKTCNRKEKNKRKGKIAVILVVIISSQQG